MTTETKTPEERAREIMTHREIIARALMNEDGLDYDEVLFRAERSHSDAQETLERYHERADRFAADLDKRGLCIEEGWRPIETAETVGRVQVYSPQFGIQFGRTYRHRDGEVTAVADGFNGEWGITHWRPMPAAPK